LAFGWTWSLGYGLDFLLGFWLFLLGALPLEKGALALVSYWSATKIILSVKVKVLGGGLCAYGSVTILLYCLWKNENISFILISYVKKFDVPNQVSITPYHSHSLMPNP
jgi:hypothetical protein